MFDKRTEETIITKTVYSAVTLCHSHGVILNPSRDFSPQLCEGIVMCLK